MKKEYVVFDKTRKDARDNGNYVYKTGKPCPYGHISERYTKSGNCILCNFTTHLHLRKKHECSKIKKDRDLQNALSKNRNTIKTATNRCQKWTIQDINIATEKVDGSYKLSNIEVANLLGRTIKGVEKCRKRYVEVNNK